MREHARGFTLIELLVVIAIIGLLSTVVLASLGTARGKGQDTSIKRQLKTVQTQAELYADTNGRYNSNGTSGLSSASCPISGDTIFNFSLFGDAVIAKALTAAHNTRGGTWSAVTRCAIERTGNSYAVAIQLVTSDTWFCVDSGGASNLVSNSAITSTGLGGGGTAGAPIVALCP